MSGVACHLTFGHRTRSEDIERGMRSSPLECTDDYTTSGVACDHHPWIAHTGSDTSGVACHHRPWTRYTVKRCWTWHIIISFGLHTPLDEVGSGNSIINLGHYTQSDNLGLDIPSSPFESTRSDDIDMECHHPLWTTQIVKRRRAWHARIALGQQT